MARTVPDEVTNFIVEQESFLVGLTGYFMRGLLNGVKPEKFRNLLIEKRLDEKQADSLIAIIVMACGAARRIKAVSNRNAVLDEMELPPPLRAVFGKMVDAALNESGEHDLQSFASRPGQIPFEFFRWVLREQDLFGLLAAVLIGSVLLTFILGVLVFEVLLLLPPVLIAIFGFLCYRMYSNIRKHFLHGHLAPAKIVSLSPYRLATHTNLCDGSENDSSDCYAVKVGECMLTEAEISTVGLGGRVGCVCSFGPGSKDGQWVDVIPMPVQHGTGQSKVILEALERIPQQDWDDFEEALTYLSQEQLNTPGLYRVPAPARVLNAEGKPLPAKPQSSNRMEIDDDLRLM